MIATWNKYKYEKAREAVRGMDWKWIGLITYQRAFHKFQVLELEYLLYCGLKKSKHHRCRVRTKAAISNMHHHKGVKFLSAEKIKYCVKCLQPLRTHPVICDNSECMRFGLLTFVYETEGND